MKNIVKILTSLLLLTSMLLSIVSCGTVHAANLMDGVTAQAVTGKNADEKFISSQMDFAAELFRRAAAESDCENTLISPLSVMIALAMTANGADGETRMQMEEILGAGISLDELNEYLYRYLDTLPSSEKYKVHLANSIWAREGKLEPQKNFLQINADYYGADVYKAPFDTSTVEDVNAWVKKHTGGMIDKIINEISPATVMYLINALSFDAEWAEKYEKSDVHDRTFTTLSGETQTVSMMYSEESKYIEDENTTGFIKDYADGKYSFVALLPDENVDFEEYVSSLTGEKISALMKNKQRTAVIAELPKFEYAYDISLVEILKTMGMTDAFDATNADFSKIGKTVDGNPLYISEVLHRTFISVDTERTKAAAVTLVATDECTIAVITKSVILDRPFVYMIVENETELPIFIGTVTAIG